MKIKSIRIENYRRFKDETFNLKDYTCFVGPNGSGKSTILAALNIFFREQTLSTTDVNKLVQEDYFNKDINQPIRITVTFNDLSVLAQENLSSYVRQNELVVTVESCFDKENNYGTIKYIGQRQGMEEFRRFFEEEKNGAKAAELNQIFEDLITQFPDLPAPRSKEDKIAALQQYENNHPDRCQLIPSEDNFYGFNGSGKLAPFIQWVYVPAVKDACEEELEAKNTALGKLIARAVRTRINFDEDIKKLKEDTALKYQELLSRNREGLVELSSSLQKRLGEWAHPNVRFGMEWLYDQNKSVVLQQPVAGIKTGEGDFIGSLARMGNGLQRSYLLALLQELANSEAPDAPTLLLGCEEPELYQHPPQARHLADVFMELIKGNNQVIITTHSPLFVTGDGFENTSIVQNKGQDIGATVRTISFEKLCERIRFVKGENPNRPIEGLMAKIHQTLQPGIAEMFFTRIPILVEGLEDVSYITTELLLSNQWSDFRRLGCHLIPVGGKDKLIQPLAIALELGLPVFVIFDADGDIKRVDHREKHERDNRALLSLLEVELDVFPSKITFGKNFVIWPSNITSIVKEDFQSDYERLTNTARQHYAQEGGLEKNEMYIAEWLTIAFQENLRSATLNSLCCAILDFAK